MNKNNAKALTLKEAYKFLPKWWLDMLDNVLSIITHSKYPSFKHAETFFCAALSFIPDKESSEIKHIQVKCENKGERNGLIYITIVIFFRYKDKEKGLWKLSKSLHVVKRETQTCYD